MPAYRFPILTFQDPAGLHTATLVEDNGDVAAVGPTAADARDQLRDHLERQYRNMPWLTAPDFDQPRLAVIKVDVRPEYTEGARVHPLGETIALRVPVVSGRTAGGLAVAALPTLGIRFNYYAQDDLRPLVAQYVQSRFRGHTPAQVSRFLCPAAVALDDVVIQVPRERRERAEEANLAELAAVADPLAAREMRARFPRAWGREDVIATLIEALRTGAAPVLLLGESGVGKTSVLADAARRVERDATPAPQATAEAAEGAKPPGRRANRFWLSSAPRVVAGMQYLGMWQERVEAVIAQAAAISGVLCLENLLDFARTGGKGAGDSIGAFLVPYLQRGELRLVAEATAAEFDACRRSLPALADLFQIVAVPAMDRATAVECLSQVAAARRQQSKIEFDRLAIETVHRLFARFMPYEAMPGKAAAFVCDLFDRAGRDARARARVTAADAVALFVRRTGLPELFLKDQLPLDAASVVAVLRRDVIGQERACRAAAGVVTTFKAGLNDPGRPLGVLLFTGPTGVGKTQLAQSLAGFLFGAAHAGKANTEDGGWKIEREATSPPPSILHPPSSLPLVRLDMSEYASHDAAERFAGSAQGAPPDWVQKVRRQPFTVLLLDEIEKASPDVFDLLLGVFDEGRLTDPWGRLTHFKSAVIIMTSNLGAAAPGPFGLSHAAPSPAYEGEAMGFFRPEFFNRIDAVVPFDPLSAESIRAVAEKELRDLAAREGLARAGVRIRWTPALVALLADLGYDARYGARPLQRAVETLVVTPLAKYLVESVARNADLLLSVDADNRLTITAR